MGCSCYFSTVNSLLTHTLPWTLQAMGYEGVWGLRMVLKINPKIPLKFWTIPILCMLGCWSCFKITGLSQTNYTCHEVKVLIPDRLVNPMTLGPSLFLTLTWSCKIFQEVWHAALMFELLNYTHWHLAVVKFTSLHTSHQKLEMKSVTNIGIIANWDLKGGIKCTKEVTKVHYVHNILPIYSN